MQVSRHLVPHYRHSSGIRALPLDVDAYLLGISRGKDVSYNEDIRQVIIMQFCLMEQYIRTTYAQALIVWSFTRGFQFFFPFLKKNTCVCRIKCTRLLKKKITDASYILIMSANKSKPFSAELFQIVDAIIRTYTSEHIFRCWYAHMEMFAQVDEQHTYLYENDKEEQEALVMGGQVDTGVQRDEEHALDEESREHQGARHPHQESARTRSTQSSRYRHE